jgi:hypothetical protein
MVLWLARVVDGGFEVLLELFFDTPLGVGKRGVSLDLAAHRAGGAESLDSRPYVPKSRIPSGCWKREPQVVCSKTTCQQLRACGVEGPGWTEMPRALGFVVLKVFGS